eukprot:TRINITY_DN25932_c1_g2_i1.p2 TRINITY_DN25932_c1_g2~~TRINITY_DN25932_c1_g2_i1.p2  ORF type:complete len:121 (+),score=0.16 TRINITY_DN25932_c1_g2_i1:268-630(+)
MIFFVQFDLISQMLPGKKKLSLINPQSSSPNTNKTPRKCQITSQNNNTTTNNQQFIPADKNQYCQDRKQIYFRNIYFVQKYQIYKAELKFLGLQTNHLQENIKIVPFFCQFSEQECQLLR